MPLASSGTVIREGPAVDGELNRAGGRPRYVAVVVTVAVKLTGWPSTTCPVPACSAVDVAAVVWTTVMAWGLVGVGERTPEVSIATTAKP